MIWPQLLLATKFNISWRNKMKRWTERQISPKCNVPAENASLCSVLNLRFIFWYFPVCTFCGMHICTNAQTQAKTHNGTNAQTHKRRKTSLCAEGWDRNKNPYVLDFEGGGVNPTIKRPKRRQSHDGDNDLDDDDDEVEVRNPLTRSHARLPAAKDGHAQHQCCVTTNQYLSTSSQCTNMHKYA